MHVSTITLGAATLAAAFLAASLATSQAAPPRCDDQYVIDMINPGNGPKNGKTPPAYGKHCAAPPVSPPADQAGNPGNIKPVGRAGDKDSDGVRGNSQKDSDWQP
jgi:hypothetical protein